MLIERSRLDSTNQPIELDARKAQDIFSDAQIELLKYILEGKDNPQIALSQNRSVQTVRQSVCKLYATLHEYRRSEEAKIVVGSEPTEKISTHQHLINYLLETGVATLYGVNLSEDLE